MARAGRQLELKGVIASAVTPHRDGSEDPDYSSCLDMLDFLAAGGAKAICLLDGVGEFFNYGFADRQRLVYLAAKRSRVPLMVGVGHTTLAGAVQLAEEAIGAGADGLLLMPPYFFGYEQPEMEAFYREFAAETREAVPLLIANAPRNATGLAVDTVRRLLDTGRFAGVSDASGDAAYFEELAGLKRERDFALVTADDATAARALRSGADAWLSPAACAVPELASGLAEAIARGEERVEAEAAFDELMHWIGRFPAPAGIKRAVELRGQKAGPPLVPLSPATGQAMDEFAEWFREWFKARQAGNGKAGR